MNNASRMYKKGVIPALVLVLVLSVLPFAAGAKTVETSIELISKGPLGLGGDNRADEPVISGDGTKIAFNSWASDILPGVTVPGGSAQVYLYDTVAETTTLLSAGPLGIGGNGSSDNCAISYDGSTVVFHSNASNLLDGVTTTNAQIYSYNTITGDLKLVTAGPSGTGGNSWSWAPYVSGDGKRIAFRSSASNLIDGVTTQTDENIYVYDADTDATILVTKGASGIGGNTYSRQCDISRDGNFVVYVSRASDMVGATTDGAHENVFVYDIAQGTTKLITPGTSGTGADGQCAGVTMSADNTKVFFVSRATNLINGFPTNGRLNVFMYDMTTQVTTLLTTGSSGNGGNGNSMRPTVSNDGTTITFHSEATDLIDGIMANGYQQVYRYDLSTGEMTLVTPGPTGNGADSDSNRPHISGDGNQIIFQSSASNLLEGFTPAHTNGNVYLWTRTVTLDVTFDPANGDAPFVEQVLPGNVIAAPAQPVRDGFVFNGWWTEDGTQWVFTDPVTDDMTLTAHWIELFTVMYDAQNGTPPLVIEATEGSLLSMPTNPTRAGYTFAGWWTEPVGGVLWDFGVDTVSADLVLYGHWIADEVTPPVNPETPATGDSMAVWPIASLALLGCAVMGTAVYRKRFDC